METLAGTEEVEGTGTPLTEWAKETRAADATTEETVVVVDDDPPT